jgi:small conductance mechanosensitive channel
MNIVPMDTGSEIAACGPRSCTVLGDIGMKALAAPRSIVICAVLAYALRFAIRRVVRRIVAGAKSKAEVTDTRALERSPLADMRLVQRTRTLGTILQNIVNVILVVVAIVLIVNIIDHSLLGSLTLLTAAVGAGLGFGAQNIVKDVLNGMFLVAEDQVGIGDVVDLGLASGVVEYVSVRITQVRDANGTLWYVRNGEITRIGNMSQGWARAIIDLGVPRTRTSPPSRTHCSPPHRARQGSEVAHPHRRETRDLGLESIEGDALVIRVVMKTRTNAMDDVARELRMRLRDTMIGLDLTVPSMATVQLAGPKAPAASTVRTRRAPAPTPSRLHRFRARILAKKKTDADKPPRSPRRRAPSPLRRPPPRRRRPRSPRPRLPRRASSPAPRGAEPAGSAEPRRRPMTEPVSFYDEVGGHATFRRLVEVFYREVARSGTEADVPGGGSRPGRGTPPDVPGAVLGRTHDLRRATRTPAAADAAHAVPRRSRRPRPLAALHAHGGGRRRALAHPRGDPVGLPRTRRACDGEHVRTEPRRGRRTDPRRTPRPVGDVHRSPSSMEIS